jgi:catechol 2,3-dioxygenase-like lactoylglutathione lyase family enzyme
MIDHYTLLVSDYEHSKAFYLRALAPLGYELVMEITREQVPDLPFERAGGLGVGGKPDLWLRPTTGAIAPTHLAFGADSKAGVVAFHEAALAAGARDNGPPGDRPHYHPGYFGAFVLDPDGYNVEAVYHTPGG